VVLSYGMGMKGVRVDGATMSVSGEKFREGCMEVVGDEGGNHVLVAVRDDKEMMHTNGVEVVLPARARKDTWLRACGTGSASLCVSIHCLCF